MSLIAMKQPYLLQVMYDTDPMDPREDYDNLGHMACWHQRYNLGDRHCFGSPSAFLQDLVRRTVLEKDIISYVQAGYSGTVRVLCDGTGQGWSVESYDSYSKEWHQELLVEGGLAGNAREVAGVLLETMPDSELVEIASAGNVLFSLELYDGPCLRMSAGLPEGGTQPGGAWGSGQVGWIYVTASEVCAEYGSVSAGNMEMARQRLLSEVQAYDYYLSGQCYGYRLYENGEECTSFCECEFGCGGHLLPDLAYAEIVDSDGQPLEEGKIGRLLITTFGGQGMPLLRYDTGDITFLCNEQCGCGRTTPRIGPILGRANNIIKIGGITFSQAQMENAILSVPQIDDYCIVVGQSEEGISTIQILYSLRACSDGFDESILKHKIWNLVRVSPELKCCSLEELDVAQTVSRLRKPQRFINRTV